MQKDIWLSGCVQSGRDKRASNIYTFLYAITIIKTTLHKLKQCVTTTSSFDARQIC